MGTFEALFEAELKIETSELTKGIKNILDGLQPSMDLMRSSEVLGAEKAEDVVNFLDKLGFLDKVVDSVVALSGRSDWVNDSMKLQFKNELKETLVETMSDMTISEVVQYIMKMKLAIQQDLLGRIPLEDGEDKPKTVVDELVRTFNLHSDSIVETL